MLNLKLFHSQTNLAENCVNFQTSAVSRFTPVSISSLSCSEPPSTNLSTALGELSGVLGSVLGSPLWIWTEARKSAAIALSFILTAYVVRPTLASPALLAHTNVTPQLSIFVSFISGNRLAFKSSRKFPLDLMTNLGLLSLSSGKFRCISPLTCSFHSLPRNSKCKASAAKTGFSFSSLVSEEFLGGLALPYFGPRTLEWQFQQLEIRKAGTKSGCHFCCQTHWRDMGKPYCRQACRTREPRCKPWPWPRGRTKRRKACWCLCAPKCENW